MAKKLTLEEAEERLSFLGIEADSFDDFKSGFSEKYAGDAKQAASKWLSPMVGEKTAKIKQNIIKKAREEGIEFTQKELEEKELEEVHDLIAERKAGKFKTELEAIKSKVGANGDEVVKDLQEKYEKAAKRASEEETLRKQLAGELDNYKQTALNEVKGVKVSYLKADQMSKLKLKPGLSELEKTGFESHIEKNFKFDFDDQGKPFVADSQGNRIRSSKKADEYKSIDEVLTETAATFKILAENPQSGKPVQPPYTPPTQGQPPQNFPLDRGRKLNPKYDNM